MSMKKTNKINGLGCLKNIKYPGEVFRKRSKYAKIHPGEVLCRGVS